MTNTAAHHAEWVRLVRQQRAAYFAWQNEQIGQTDAREAYIVASAELEKFHKGEGR